MADKIYVVTLKDRNDLEGFYSDMASAEHDMHCKRPLSRNTQYYLTDSEAETIRSDPRVLAVELRPQDMDDVVLERFSNYTAVNNTSYGFGGDFRKDGGFNDNDRQWGHLHVAVKPVGNRRKGQWGGGTVNDSIDVFNNGKHVDVVIVDDPVAIDAAEWDSPTTGGTRFVQYDWYNELNGYISSIDDDGISIPSAPYPNYHPNSALTAYHGNHVAGTIAGKWYGWAPEANIYSLQVLSNPNNQGVPVDEMLVFDYLRAFHRNKPINPITGKRNPTITNHSWGYSTTIKSGEDLTLSDIDWVEYRGTKYEASNPNPSGWTLDGIEKDFGLGASKRKINYHYWALTVDVEDAIADGVVVIGAAGNNDIYMCSNDTAHESYVDWNNRASFKGYLTRYINRGSSPCNAKGVITVGAIGINSDFRRVYFSNFGPGVDVYAPGQSIVSSWVDGNNIHSSTGLQNTGSQDGKYGGTNWYYNISGTSMASPQVAGVAACLATGRERFTNSDVLAYIRRFGLKDDMTFDVGGNPSPVSYEVDVTNQGSVDYIFSNGTNNINVGNDPTIYLDEGDTVKFNMNAPGHPFLIKTVQGIGSSDLVSGVVGQGSETQFVEWTPSKDQIGTFYYQCEHHNQMYGVIKVSPWSGTLADPTASGGHANNGLYFAGPNLELRVDNPRPTSGHIDGWYQSTLKGHRRDDEVERLGSVQLYPRVNSYYRPLSEELYKTFNITIGDNGTDFQVSGDDRLTTHAQALDPVITVKKGDTLKLGITGATALTAVWLSISQSTGQPSSGLLPGGSITNNGASNGTITWNTAGALTGTYYYNDEAEASMSGQIHVYV